MTLRIGSKANKDSPGVPSASKSCSTWSRLDFRESLLSLEAHNMVIVTRNQMFTKLGFINFYFVMKHMLWCLYAERRVLLLVGHFVFLYTCADATWIELRQWLIWGGAADSLTSGWTENRQKEERIDIHDSHKCVNYTESLSLTHTHTHARPPARTQIYFSALMIHIYTRPEKLQSSCTSSFSFSFPQNGGLWVK